MVPLFSLVPLLRIHPSELNSALLSRCRVHVLEAVSSQDIVVALQRALQDTERGLGGQKIEVSQASLLEIAKAADGDVRRALTLLEIAAELAQDEQITADLLSQVLADRSRRFDKRGSSSMTRFRPCTRVYVVPTRMRHCIGCCVCWMVVVILSTWPGA